MSNPHSAESVGQVVSLEKFRERLLEAKTRPPIYEDVDHLTYHQIGEMLEGLHGRRRPENFIVVSRFVQEPSSVISGRDRHNWLYGVDINIGQRDELTEDLVARPRDDEKEIRPSLERLLLTSLIAEHVLKASKYKIPESGLKLPKIGEPIMKVRYDEDPVKYMEITRWRTASGLGLRAIAGTRPELDKQLRDYLNFTLGRRLQTLTGRARHRQLVGTASGDNPQFPNTLIGLCNPLTPSDLSQIQKPKKVRRLTTV